MMDGLLLGYVDRWMMVYEGYLPFYGREVHAPTMRLTRILYSTQGNLNSTWLDPALSCGGDEEQTFPRTLAVDFLVKVSCDRGQARHLPTNHSHRATGDGDHHSLILLHHTVFFVFSSSSIIGIISMV